MATLAPPKLLPIVCPKVVRKVLDVVDDAVVILAYTSVVESINVAFSAISIPSFLYIAACALNRAVI
jgi:hypothetical protein